MSQNPAATAMTVISSQADLGGPVYEIVEITPEIAKEWLRKFNTHNRNLREKVVAGYATDMANGKWRETGDNIKRAHDGTIIDGQHRLHAIVRSGVTLRMLVVSNLPMEVQENVDGQAKRKFSDVLQLRGEHHYNVLAAVTRRAWYWTNDYRPLSHSISPTTQQLIETLNEFPNLRESAKVGEHVRANVSIAGSILGVCHWLFNDIEVFDCAHFFERLADGANLSTDHPIYVLRRTVRENQSAKARLTEETLMAYVIKAWNAYRDGRPMGLLRYKPGGANPEQFPEPK